jgi:predicted MFS family arabinose efflux permease
VAGLLASQSFTWIFVGDALSSAIYGVLALTLLPETSPEPAASRREAREGYREVLADRRFLVFLVAMIAATFVYIQSIATLPLFMTDHGMSMEVFGLLLGLNALLVVFFELPITHVLERYRPSAVIANGLVLLAAGFAMTAAAATLGPLVLCVIVWTVGEMVYTPMSSAHPGRFAASTLRGRYQGAYGLAHTLGASLGPALGGALYGADPDVLWLTCGAVGVGAAALVVAAQPRPGQVAPPREPVATAADPFLEAPVAGTGSVAQAPGAIAQEGR